MCDKKLRAKVGTENQGKFFILDVNTGDYEIDAENLVASERILERRPDAELFGVRIGHRAAYRLLQEKGALRQSKVEHLRKDIAIGIEAADKGELAPLDVEAIIAEGHKRLAERAHN